MTIIVYDQKSLITDSRGMALFGDGRSLAYSAPKIHFNEGRTVALAYCGETHPEWLNKWFLTHAEMALAISLMMDVRSDNPLDGLVKKALRQARNIAESIPFPPKDFINGIAISRDHAVRLDASGPKDITEDNYNGFGCYTDSYWLMRSAGFSVARAMQTLNECSNLVGGEIHMQPQSGLAEFDIMDYLAQINASGDYKDITFQELRLRAKKPSAPSKAKKAKCTTSSKTQAC